MSNLPVYYVSAHSKIPKKSSSAGPTILSNTYLIMTAKCGDYASVENQSFLKKWLSTDEGVKRLKNLVLGGTHPVNINGRRVYRPGNDGPPNQPLDFLNSKGQREVFYLGLTRAPINLEQIKADALNRIHRLPKSFLIKAFKHVKEIYDADRSNSNAENEQESPQPERMSPKALISEIDTMVYIMSSSNKRVSIEQLEKVIYSRTYSRKLLVNRTIPFEYTINGSKNISQLIREGPGIYIIDACRGISGVEKNVKGITTVFPSKKQKYRKNISFPVGTFNAYENPELGKNNRNLIKGRIEYSGKVSNYRQNVERGKKNVYHPYGRPLQRENMI